VFVFFFLVYCLFCVACLPYWQINVLIRELTALTIPPNWILGKSGKKEGHEN